MARVRLAEETAKELRLAEELWLPKHTVKVEAGKSVTSFSSTLR